VSTIGVVAASAGGVEVLRTQLVPTPIDRGHTVAVTLTPTAGEWLRVTSELDKLQDLTGLPARDQPRLPSEHRPHPPIDVFAAAPLSVNSVAKLALGIADNQALTMLCENIAHVPMVVFPRINAAHARQPAWADHISRLRSVGVELIYGDAVWPLAKPRAAGPRELPWPTIIDAVLLHC
jgi:Flavoprotein